MPASYEGIPARVKLVAATDETGIAYLDPKTPQFGLALVAFGDAGQARDAVVRARSEWANRARTPEDRRTVDRGCFHATADSTSAREFFCQVARDLTLTVWFDMYDKGRPMPAEIRPVEGKPNTGKALYHSALEAVVGSLGACYCHEANVHFAEHQQFIKDGHLAELRNRFHNITVHAIAGNPHSPGVYPILHPEVTTPKKEPLLDVVDYCMWAVQRSKLAADMLTDKNPPDHYLRLIGLTPAGRAWGPDGYFRIEHFYIGQDATDSQHVREWEDFLDRRFIDTSTSPLFEEVEQSVLAVPDPVLATLHPTALAEYRRLREAIEIGLDALNDRACVEFAGRLLTLLDTVPLLPQMRQDHYRLFRGDLGSYWLQGDGQAREFDRLLRSWQEHRRKRR